MAVRDVVVKLNGGSHTLRSTLGAWAAVEDTGLDYLQVIQRLAGEGPKMRSILVLLWAFMDHEKPRPSMDDVKSWVTSENFGDVATAVAEAYRDGSPIIESGGPPGADAGSGQPSASSPPA